jgi:hypothetical protein
MGEGRAGDAAANAAGADAFQSELYRKVGELVPVLDCEGPLKSVVLESEGTTFVSEPVGETGYFWHVATDADATLGFTQAIMRKFRTRVLDSVNALVGDSTLGQRSRRFVQEFIA